MDLDSVGVDRVEWVWIFWIFWKRGMEVVWVMRFGV